MIPDIALIKSENKYKYNKRICGLYPLERNILLLLQIGIKKIYLDLSTEERSFYEKKIIKHLKQFKNMIILKKNNQIKSVLGVFLGNIGVPPSRASGRTSSAGPITRPTIRQGPWRWFWIRVTSGDQMGRLFKSTGKNSG